MLSRVTLPSVTQRVYKAPCSILGTYPIATGSFKKLRQSESSMDDIVTVPTIEEGRERIIERAIMDHPEKLGFPGALSIRNCRLALHSGLVDIVLLPKDGPVRLVLVEAKCAVAPDAACKVIGQLLKYYAGALMLGSDVLIIMRSFAANDEARDTTKKPLVRTTGISPSTKAWEAIKKGTPVAPEQVCLFVALDDEPHAALVSVIATLRQHHRLPIGLVVVKDATITVN